MRSAGSWRAASCRSKSACFSFFTPSWLKSQCKSASIPWRASVRRPHCIPHPSSMTIGRPDLARDTSGFTSPPRPARHDISAAPARSIRMARWLASWAALEQPEQEYMRGWSVMGLGQPARHDKECPAATGGGVFLIYTRRAPATTTTAISKRNAAAKGRKQVADAFMVKETKGAYSSIRLPSSPNFQKRPPFGSDIHFAVPPDLTFAIIFVTIPASFLWLHWVVIQDPSRRNHLPRS